MIENNVLEFTDREAISDPLTALLRSGAQQLINQAVETELRLSLKRRRIGFSRAYLKPWTRHWRSTVRLLVSAVCGLALARSGGSLIAMGSALKKPRTQPNRIGRTSPKPG